MDTSFSNSNNYVSDINPVNDDSINKIETSKTLHSQLSQSYKN